MKVEVLPFAQHYLGTASARAEFLMFGNLEWRFRLVILCPCLEVDVVRLQLAKVEFRELVGRCWALEFVVLMEA
jgi:hypothetical protein